MRSAKNETFEAAGPCAIRGAKIFAHGVAAQLGSYGMRYAQRAARTRGGGAFPRGPRAAGPEAGPGLVGSAGFKVKRFARARLFDHGSVLTLGLGPTWAAPARVGTGRRAALERA